MLFFFLNDNRMLLLMEVGFCCEHDYPVCVVVQVSLLVALTHQQQQQQSTKGSASFGVSQFMTSGAACSVANQMFSSVENMCQIVQMMETPPTPPPPPRSNHMENHTSSELAMNKSASQLVTPAKVQQQVEKTIYAGKLPVYSANKMLKKKTTDLNFELSITCFEPNICFLFHCNSSQVYGDWLCSRIHQIRFSLASWRCVLC